MEYLIMERAPSSLPGLLLFILLVAAVMAASGCAMFEQSAESPAATTVPAPLPQGMPDSPEFHDGHFHLTNYVQKGISVEAYLAIMGDRVGRSTLFGIPLQQTWSHQNSGDFAPGYYLHSDAPLYYYSFTDAYIARLYQELTPEQQARFDPMITGFNPADMYAVDHIRRVLTLFPGVFSGIGEFSIHKEFVSAKVAGEVASLTNPALDRIFDFCAETGLVAILHNDIDMPFAKEGAEPVYLTQMKDLLRRHQKTAIIWAHTGLGRVVRPIRSAASAGAAQRSPGHLQILEGMLTDPELKHVYFDISWDEVAKYVVFSEESVQRTADLLNRFPDRFLFGTDNVAPKDQESHFAVFEMYAPLWEKLTPEASDMIRKGNYERLFDSARQKVRAWERANTGAGA
jgi:hypothetical protein